MSQHEQETGAALGSVPHAYYAREGPQTGVVLLPDQERHDTGEHPENVRRLPGVVEYLRGAPEWDDLFVLYPRYARREDVERSHSPASPRSSKRPPPTPPSGSIPTPRSRRRATATACWRLGRS